jgi:hypothetical protein
MGSTRRGRRLWGVEGEEGRNMSGGNDLGEFDD